MSLILRVVERADGSPSPEASKFIESANHDAGHAGRVELTGDPRCAMQFATHGEAWEFWRRQSRSVPLRPDGRPNRPLTAYTVSIEHFSFK